MERVADRRRTEQGFHLRLAHAGLQLLDRRLFDQIALIDRLLVQQTTTAGGQGDDRNEKEFLHGRVRSAGLRETGPMIHSGARRDRGLDSRR